ncbi:NEAT domain-containing protein [Weissella confusa]|uniref:NEAT domain-containing protein n=1 Tax=Weissella confusa TaxID=1583 RepID=UPI0018F268A5|nr:NEAT domain-containing protein [Weissella confusa]MBJ7659767.1 hypothetical protein [Weissella confusa]
MSNLSRTAVLFSTAVLGGMLLTTSINSVATVAYAAENTASINSTTGASNAIMSADVPMTASDGMGNFFNATAKLAVKGDTTDVTISFQDSKANMLDLIPDLTFDGITQKVNGQQAITFTIPTDDLKPKSGTTVSLPSFTSVPMSPSKGYKSDLTFDLASLLPSESVSTGTFALPVSADGVMGTWFDKSFSTEIGWITSKVTVSYQASKEAMLGMIPSLTFDNITKSVNGQRSITFDIPTKDLNPDSDGIAQVASFTSVPMSPSKGYKSTLSFNMINSPAQPEQGASGDSKDTITESPSAVEQASTHVLRILQANNDEESMASTYMLDTVKLSKNEDGTYYAYLTTHTPAIMGKNPIDFTDINHAAKLLSTNLVDNYYQSVFRLTLTESEIKAPTTTSIHVEFTSPITYNENYDIRLVVGEQLSDETPTDNQNADTSVSDNTGAISDSSATPDTNVLQDGVYKVPFTNYKTGTTTASSMNNFLKTPATVTVKNGQANIDIETSNESIMGMMSQYRFNDVKATAKGTHWLVTLPVNALSKTIATGMTISMNGRVIESPTADMLFDVKKAIHADDSSLVSEVPDSTTSDKPAPSQPVTKPVKPSALVTDDETDSTRILSILQADKNEQSMAANYILPTIKLTKNADGTYYAYLTTHTPAMMGQNPIRFNDAKHAAELMSTNLVNGYYQSVFRLTLSESELTTPISTHIHVQFTSPLVYDENYEIRLVIGDQLSSNASVNNQNELTDTVIVPRETATTATTFEPAPVTFTTVASSVPMAPTPLAVTHPISSPQTATTSTLATSDKTIKLTPAKKQTVSKNKNDKSTSKPSQSDAPKHSKITRATMITAGVVITAAVGFVGASLALNIFKHQ